jgi:hypothetical protein
MEGLTNCSITLTMRRASGLVMPAAVALGGPFESGAAQAVHAARRHNDLHVAVGVHRVLFGGIGRCLEEQVIDERAILHAAHLEPQGQAGRLGFLVERFAHNTMGVRGQRHNGCRGGQIFGSSGHEVQSTTSNPGMRPPRADAPEPWSTATSGAT